MRWIYTIFIAVMAIILGNFILMIMPSSKPKSDIVIGIIESYNYTAEFHSVETPDGHVLSVQRIISETSTLNKTKKPILLLHGLLNSAFDFIALGPKQSLAFALSDEGFDVWLGNFRGCDTFKRHKHFTSDNSLYWNFTFDEIARYDVPSMVDYVLNQTSAKQLNCIGFSQGANELLLAYEWDLEMVNKVNKQTVIAPATIYTEPPKCPFCLFANLVKPIMQKYGKNYPPFEFGKNLLPIIHLYNAIASINGLEWLHWLPIYLTQGSINLIKTESLSKTMPHFASMSYLTFMHLQQHAFSEIPRRYDRGPEKNLKSYGQEEPPTYNLSKVTTPTGIIWTKKDVFIHPHGIVKLEKLLPNVTLNYVVPLDDFSHLDFVYGIEENVRLYHQVVINYFN